MHQGLADMKQPVGRDSRFAEPGQQEIEIPQIRLVAADRLGREDALEDRAEAFHAARDPGLMDVGEDEEAVSLGQTLQRLGRVGKGRPIRDAGPEGARAILGNFGLQFLTGRAEGLRQNIRIKRARRGLLDAVLVTAENLEQAVVVAREPGLIGPRAEMRQDAAFPVD